ncbi:hypothetical protein BBJ28_00017943 [Nothophytophthora sp. Chile5]|nr:hypothetical protein BBJ28_00017943 [Nothophytophthora sp. Chile5]
MGRDRESDEDFAPAEDEDDGAAGIPVPVKSAQAQELAGAIAEPPLEEKVAQTATPVQAAKEPKPRQSTGARRKQGRKRLDPSGKSAPPPAVKPGASELLILCWVIEMVCAGGNTNWTTPRSPEYIPRQRKSKSAETIQKIAGRTHVTNLVAPIPRKAFSSWSELEKAVEAHEKEHYLLFRRRSSVTTEQYNSLVVTSPTGRGVPILDFMVLNEQTDTMRVILKFFKQHNPGWTEIVSYIINKDFVEWRILEEMFVDAKVLLCHSSQASYDRAYKEFKKTCDDVLAYFNKNWHICREMWSNHLRGKYFTAGNTTTNRIGSNWNQLKLLLGRKTGIDRTTKFRNPRHIPDFLRPCSAVVSNYVLDKLRSEWTQFRVTMAEATCVRRDDTSEWEVDCKGHSYVCNGLSWTCTCLFYSNQPPPPCLHLQFVARLPSKEKKRSVAYVRLRRSERGNNLMLSPAEKFCYAKTMFDPGITHLKHLPSHKFHADLDMWRKVVGEVMEGEEGQSDATSFADETDSDDSDALTVMDPSEIFDTLDLMTAMMATNRRPSQQPNLPPATQPAMIPAEMVDGRPIDTADLAVSTLSQISLDAIELSESSQAMLNDTEPSYTDAMSPGLGVQVPPASETTQEPEPEAEVTTASAPAADSPQRGGVESINLPPPIGMGNPRQERVQGWAAKASMQRYNLGEVLFVLQKIPVIMDEKALHRWDPETKTVSREEARQCAYGFVTPKDLVDALQLKMQGLDMNESAPVAVDSASPQKGTANSADDDVSAHINQQEIIVTVKKGPGMWNGLLAADVIAKFEGSCMASRYSIKSGTATIRFDEMVGYLAGDRWLNDAIMSYAVHAICSESPECYVLSSLVCDIKFPNPPDMSIGDAKFVILPVNTRRIHWCLILVSLDVPNKIEAHFYDPTRGQSYREHVQGVWKDQLLLFLNR